MVTVQLSDKVDLSIVNQFQSYYSSLPTRDQEDISSMLYHKRIKRKKKSIPLYGECSRGISVEDFERLLSIETSHKARLCYLLMFYNGLRISEVTRINLRHLNTVKWVLTLQDTKSALKNDYIIICKRVRKDVTTYISHYLKEIRNNNGFLFYSKSFQSEHISKDWLRNNLNRRLKLLGLREQSYAMSTETKKGKKSRNLYLYSSHSLRHSFAKMFYARLEDYYCESVKLDLVRIAMRHTKIDTTMTYLREDKEKVHNILSNW